MHRVQTFGPPSSAGLDQLASAARRVWAEMFEVRAEFDYRLDAVRLMLRHGKNSYTQVIDRMVLGKAASRTAAAVERPEDLLLSNVEVTD